MAETIVKIENLVKRYHELVAVDHFNLTVSKGEILGLLGPNGSGKTTTMNCLLSLLAYDKGSIEVFGKPMKPDSYDLKRNIGVVFQNVAVFDTLTVQENIDYFCGLYIKDKKLRRHYMEEVEQICSRIVIMDKGRNLANGTATELKQLIKKSETLTVEILELTDTQLEAVRRLNHVYDVSYENNRLTVQCSGGSHNLIHLLSYLQEENIAFGRVYSELPTLNDVFLEITGSELRD